MPIEFFRCFCYGLHYLCAVSISVAVCLALACTVALALMLTVSLAMKVDVYAIISVYLWEILLWMVFRKLGRPAGPMPSPSAWPGVRKLEAGSSEAVQLSDYVRNHCKNYSSRYSFTLEVDAVYSVDKHSQRLPRMANELPKLHAADSHVLQLFHGTSLENARSIIAKGFRLPSRQGMFGRGIYFADTPLKSWQYSKGSGYLLVVDVALGNALKLHAAKAIVPQKDFRRGWLMRLIGARDYHSVIGLTHEQGGSLRVPEYVIYDPNQTAIRYIVKFKEVKKAG